MQKVAVVTDSLACLSKEQVGQYGIEIIPVNFYAGGKLYKDWINVTPTQAWELFLKDPESFKSSAPSPEDCLKSYRESSKRARDIFCVTISTKLSSVYNAAQRAKELVKTELPQASIEIMDSQTATASEGFITLTAARAAMEGKGLTEVVNAALQIKDRVNAIVLLDTIRHVYRSGRIPKVASQIGSMFNIRPIFSISGAVHFKGAVRNRTYGIDTMKEPI